MPNIKINSKIYQQDYIRNVGSLAIKLPMNSTEKKSQSDIFNLSYTTEEQAISNFVNLLLTKSGERYMQPLFGVGLMNYIFEQSTMEMQAVLESAIVDQAAAWLPYIKINELILLTDDSNAINITIAFQVSERGANREMTFTGNRELIEIGIS